MKLAVIVTEYPKATETFILRDVVTFLKAGTDVRIYHLAPYRHREILHEFARPTREIAGTASALSGGATWRGLAASGRALGTMAARTVRAHRAEPLIMTKSLGLFPKSLAIAEELEAWGCDHVHAEFAGHPATAAWIVNARTGIPYSVSCRAHDIFRTQNLLAEKLGAAAFVRTISDFNKAFLLDHVSGLDPARIHVIHSSVPTDEFAPLPPPATGVFSVAYVGSLQKRKGVDVLLRALGPLSARRPWRCDIVGGGPEAGRLHALSAELGLGDSVVFHGPQPYQRVAEFYRDANVVVAPSVVGPRGRTEGIPNVMIEALAYQRPAISTRVSGIPELIRHGRTGLLTEPGSVGELARALAWVRAQPEEAYAMAVAGRAEVERSFDLAVNARRQLDLFAAHSRARGRVCLEMPEAESKQRIGGLA
jgi:glycosyltransferase involved in cell wall biosynthesis